MFKVRILGYQFYLNTLKAMQDFTEKRNNQTIDEVWVVEHAPIFTIGQSGNILDFFSRNNGIDLVKVDRGGQITYHGPGQIVCYLLLNLRRCKLAVRELVNFIESAIIRTLALYKIIGIRKKGFPGIYLSNEHGIYTGAKISALGLKIRNGCSYHGVSLNVNMDLTPFKDINACGFKNLNVVDMYTLVGIQANWKSVANTLINQLYVVFHKKYS